MYVILSNYNRIPFIRTQKYTVRIKKGMNGM